MNLAVIGVGYVGLVTGACLADVGNHVSCMDRDAGKIARLERGEIPIFEPGLDEVVRRNAAGGRLAFTTDMARAVCDADIIFIAVGTPPAEDGSADVGRVLEAAMEAVRYIDRDVVLVVKSTVPVGTCDRVRDAVQALLRTMRSPWKVTVASNPEFLKEGSAIEDFQRPDRIVVGTYDTASLTLLRALYSPYNRNHDRLIAMDVRSSEFTKYAANAMLATRISLMNELARLAEKVGADIEEVRRGAGADPRIGHHFLYAGVGYGGSCLPKDVSALSRLAADNDEPLDLLAGVQRVNERQKHLLFEKVGRLLGDLSGRTIAIWGLAFKPNTDDIRDAPSLVLIRELLAAGARVKAYDPVAAPGVAAVINDPDLVLTGSAKEACQGADVLVVVTEWREFKSPDFRWLAKTLRQPAIFDGRNIYDAAYVQECGLRYFGVGRGETAVEPVVTAVTA
ncbi:UDP-glucose 6-dehydrogenase 2 [Pigmentiphaga litoralis]|jgi:UDPglucose 6-dehydrogenase|uniref:UDP-glucose dehydrogenase family protein n=1 Tax=Pigmentiphaga litoralis TaxID=516702 RepID=UPI001678E9B8|nr:UDP-glucose/GDP-mannose dehydrogenase family protein [Pigmentiphaga litoralis]GGX04586.1 UDP-glucose 6-dehydrogenase 2 [Pigmentiphaga litoralis]